MTEQEFTLTQPGDAHRVTVVQDGEGYLVRCNECDRLFRIGAGGVYEELVQGDMLASHSFGMGGVKIKGVTVPTEADSDIERLLDDVSVDFGERLE